MAEKTLQDVINKLHANQQVEAQQMQNLQKSTQATADEIKSLNKIFSNFLLGFINSLAGTGLLGIIDSLSVTNPL